MKELTKEQLYCLWVHYQWGGGVDKRDYWEGHKEGFEHCLHFMLQEGYIQLTDKCKNYEPFYKET